MIRHPESDEEVADLDHVDPELAVLISRLNESCDVVEDREDSGVHDFQEVWIPAAEGQGALDRREAAHRYPEMLPVSAAVPEEAVATTKRQDLPEELEELGLSFQSALFPGLKRPGEKQEGPEIGLSKTETTEGRISMLSVLGLASLAISIFLGAIWYGSQMNMKIENLNKTVVHLEQQAVENRASIQETEQELGNIVRLHEENGQSIQKIERVLEDTRLSTIADIEILNKQIGDLRDVSVGIDIQEPPVPTLKPSRDLGGKPGLFRRP